MEKLCVDFDLLDDLSFRLGSCADLLEDEMSSIRSVLSALPACRGASAAAGPLHSCLNSLGRKRDRCSTLARNIRRVSGLFAECEQDLAGEFRDGLETEAGGENIWESPWLSWLDDLLDSLGIDPFGRNYRDPGEAAQEANDSLMQRQISAIFTGSLGVEAWNAASTSERQQMLREVIARINGIQGTDVVNIDFFYEQPQNGMITNGYYQDGNRSIHINMYQADDFEGIMTTVVHEMRHAYQHSVTGDPDSYIVSEGTARSWSENFRHYISSDTDYPGYRAQPVEQDARDFSEAIRYL